MYRTSAFRCIDFCFDVETNDSELHTVVEQLYVSCATNLAAEHTLSILATHSTGEIEIAFDGDSTFATSSAAIAVARLIWEINSRSVASPTSNLLLHAGAIERDGIGVLLPGAQNHGKSTLTAAAVVDGFRYLSDEVASYDAERGVVVAVPKPITLEPGSWPVLPALAPRPPEHFPTAFNLAWQVPPASVRPDAVVREARPRLIVAPRYEQGASLQVEKVSRAHTAVTLAQQSFNFDRLGASALGMIADLVRGADCYELRYGTSEAACDALRTLVRSAAPTQA